LIPFIINIAHLKNSDDKSDMGQFFTPLKIVCEMVNMVTVSNDMEICDPASGVGKFLLEAASTATFKVENGVLIEGVHLHGFEKQMSGQDDITTILAKANALIYFSKLFRDNNDVEEVQYLAQNLLNKVFSSSKTALGTLRSLEPNKYDLILANPPYYQDATIMKLADAVTFGPDKEKAYTARGNGVELLFLEWIIKSLKYGGTANIVLPDGMFTNLGNTNLKEMILKYCYIESIISLPINSFFNTPKKTYIFTLKKKSQEDVDAGVQQNHRIFAYICKSIGETLDVYRFDIPDDDDLHNAVVKLNSYKSLADKESITDPFASWFGNDGKMKLLSISDFPADGNWNIDNFWSNQEKITLGFKEADNVMTLSEFQSFIDQVMNDMVSYKEAIECLKNIH